MNENEPAPPPPEPPPKPAPQADRWAHRRGEPRTFAAAWILFLFGATVISVGAVGALGLLSPDVYRPAARVMVEIVAVGIAVLWPMVRLSQAAPRDPLRAALQDVFVIAGPVQAVVWPQAFVWMANWPPSAVAALDGLLCGWAFLVGGVLAVYFASVSAAGQVRVDYTTAGDESQQPVHTPHPGVPRWVMMSLILVIVLMGPLVAVLLGPVQAGSSFDPSLPPSRVEWLMTSPLTGVYEITRDRSWTGQWASVDARHWVGVGLAWGAGAVAWVAAAWLRSRAGVAERRSIA